MPTFGRFNLIYGWNGSGKTTISNLFRALELRRQSEGEATLVTSSTTINGNDFTLATLPVRVFNRDFVAANVFPVGGGELPPIFILGEENAEQQAQVEQFKRERDEAQQILNTKRQEKDQAERVLDRYCVDRALVIKDTLRSAGNNPYNNYDKARYKQRIMQMIRVGDMANHLLTEAERERLLTQSKAIPKASIVEVQLRLPDLTQITQASVELLQKSVVSFAIAALKDDPQLSSWTRDGLGMHRHREADVCLFCEQPLPNGRLSALEAHFSTEYEQLIRQLDAQISQIESISRTINEVSVPNRAELYEDLAPEFDLANEQLDSGISTITEYLASLIKAIIDKKQKVFESQALNVTLPTINPDVIVDINAIIQRHNQTCIDFSTHVSTARTKLEADSVARSLTEYQGLADALDAQEAAIVLINGQIHRLTEQISELERDIIEHRQPADELNQDLRNYLGHAELQLSVSDTGYAITRSGTPARSLSEGEMTAIALLYFLKTLKDRRFSIEDSLIVLDDPVSSLDSNALFMAFGFIRNRVEEAAQIIILTHNFTLFRQIRNWFYWLNYPHRNQAIEQRPARLYMMDCTITQDGRRSRIAPLDPLLEKFESEYHFMFDRIYRRANSAAQGGLESNYIFPNMARRMLETFLAFRRPQHSGDLRQKLRRVDFDESRKIRILRFLHTHSHADAIIDPEHDPVALGEAQAVLADLLALIQHEDPSHYEAMVALVDPPHQEQTP